MLLLTAFEKAKGFLYPERRIHTGAAKYLPAATMLSCIILTILASACSDDDGVSAKKQIIPFNKNNTWIYQDTSSSDMGIFASVDTVTITDSRKSHDTVWWKFSAPFNPYIDGLEFAATADTVYTIQHTDSPTGMRGRLSKEYVSAPPNGSYTYTSLYAGDAFYEKTVKKLTVPLVIPAGTFYSCYEYTYSVYPNNITEIVCPGIGMIKLTIESDLAGPGAFKYTRILKKYTLH